MKLSYLQLALSMCLVGINIAVGKVISQEIPVFLFANIRFIIGAAFLIPVVFFYRKKIIRIDMKGWLCIFLQSLFGVFLFSIFMLYGVRHTSAVSAGIITSTTPACIALIAFFFLKEKLNIYGTCSVMLAISGIVLISIHPGIQGIGNTGNIVGNLLIICAVISEALFTIFAKSVSKKLDSLQMAAIVNVFGLLLFLPFSIHSLLTTRVMITPYIWLLIIYYSLTASVFSFFLWFRGIVKVPANVAGLFTVFMPVSATLVGIIFLNESFTVSQAMGTLLAIAAIFLGIRTPRKIK